MGANAQTSVPTFTAGDVLTAANMNISASTGVPVFATTATRDAAFGGTGEKVLAEGQMCYVENLTGIAQLQYYDGSTWNSLSAGAMVRTVGETSFSGSSSVTTDSAFSSTYRNYKIFINYTTSTTNILLLRFRTGNASVSTATYNTQYFDIANTTTAAARDIGATNAFIGGSSNGSFNNSLELTVYAPNVATATTWTSLNHRNSGAYNVPALYINNGNQSDSTAMTGFELYPNTGTISGTYTVYGLATS